MRCAMYLTLLWTSAPFALVGLTLTYLRLRAARLHGGWVLLFFVPLLNVMLFLSLCLLPSRAQEEGASAGVRGWQRFVPRDERGSWWAGALLPAPIGIAFCLMGVYGFQQYGWGLFVGAPFAVGLLAPVIAGAHAPRTRGESLAVAGTALLMWGAGLLLLALEGALCLVMAAPIAAVLGLLGALVGHTLQARPNRPGAEWLSLLALLCVPALMGAEDTPDAAAPVRGVHRHRDRRAPRGRLALCDCLPAAAQADRVALPTVDCLPD